MTKTTKRTEAQIRRELTAARKREHCAVESCSNERPASIARAWALADATNVLLRELAALEA